MAEQILLLLTPRAAQCGFLQAGTKGGNRKLTLHPGGTGSVAERECNTTGGRRIGSQTRRAGRPRAEGKARETDTSENTGLR